MKEYTIKLTKYEIVLFTVASAIILEYAYVAFVAMSGNGMVTNDFNRFHEGWFEFVLMLGIGLYILLKTFRSQRVE